MPLNEDIQELKIEFREFKATVDQWMSTTTEYRKHLCDKIDIINAKIIELPCKERKGFFISYTKQLNFLWGIISGMGIMLLKHLLIDKK